jgi:hypothetical protein
VEDEEKVRENEKENHSKDRDHDFGNDEACRKVFNLGLNCAEIGAINEDIMDKNEIIDPFYYDIFTNKVDNNSCLVYRRIESISPREQRSGGWKCLFENISIVPPNVDSSHPDNEEKFQEKIVEKVCNVLKNINSQPGQLTRKSMIDHLIRKVHFIHDTILSMGKITT